MLGIKGKLVSTKQKVFKVLRLISGLGKEDHGISSSDPVFDRRFSYETVNSLTNFSLEVESKKAKALAHWRRWDRPK